MRDELFVAYDIRSSFMRPIIAVWYFVSAVVCVLREWAKKSCGWKCLCWKCLMHLENHKKKLLPATHHSTIKSNFDFVFLCFVVVVLFFLSQLTTLMDRMMFKTMQLWVSHIQHFNAF